MPTRKKGIKLVNVNIYGMTISEHLTLITSDFLFNISMMLEGEPEGWEVLTALIRSPIFPPELRYVTG